MTATRTKPITLGLFTALSRLARGAVDDAAVQVLVGDAVAKTHAEVSRILGVAANTIKQSWAPEGMPGKQGNYPIASIVAWRLRYLAEIENRKLDLESLSDNQLDRQQAEEELRKIKLQNDKLEREEQVAMGNLIDRGQASTAVKTAAAVLTERLMKLPAKIEPSLPQEIAPSIVATMERDIRRELVGFTETTSRDVMKEGNS